MPATNWITVDSIENWLRFMDLQCIEMDKLKTSSTCSLTSTYQYIVLQKLAQKTSEQLI